MDFINRRGQKGLTGKYETGDGGEYLGTVIEGEIEEVTSDDSKTKASMPEKREVEFCFRGEWRLDRGREGSEVISR